jgi:hypothetical protein
VHETHGSTGVHLDRKTNSGATELVEVPRLRRNLEQQYIWRGMQTLFLVLTLRLYMDYPIFRLPTVKIRSDPNGALASPTKSTAAASRLPEPPSARSTLCLVRLPYPSPSLRHRNSLHVCVGRLLPPGPDVPREAQFLRGGLNLLESPHRETIFRSESAFSHQVLADPDENSAE